MMQKVKRLLFGLICASMMMHPVMHAFSVKKDLFCGIAAAATAVAATVGAAKLWDWYFVETNAQLLDRAIKVYENALVFVDNYSVVALENMFNMPPITIQDGYKKQYYFPPLSLDAVAHAYNTLNEPILYEMATMWFNQSVAACCMIDKIVQASDQLADVCDALEKRIQEVDIKNLDLYEVKIIQKMNKLYNHIAYYALHLQFTAQYVSKHKSYFALYDEEAFLGKKYYEYLDTVKSDLLYSTKCDYIRHYVSRDYNHTPYPYFSFVTDIDSGIASLKSYIRQCSAMYSTRLYYAQQLLDQLQFIKGVITSDSRYAQEKYQYRQDQLERERLEILKQQARAQQAMADAQNVHNALTLSSRYCNKHYCYNCSDCANTTQINVVVN